MTDSKSKPPLKTECTQHVDGRFASGQVLGGKYKVIDLLGKGGMGAVYRVQQIFLHQDLALKVLDMRNIVDEVQIRRFQLEAKAAHSLRHPNLVGVQDFGVLDDDQPYLVMDLVEGITLEQFLKEQGPLSVAQAGPMFAQVCFGLQYAHDQSVIHRDIKPSNIMLVDGVPFGTEGSVKIVDFGIAKLAGESGGEIQALTKTGEIFGSPLYMSPEQCSGGVVDNRADIYALGCVIYESLTGTPPHVGANALRTMMLHQSDTAPWMKEASLGKEFPDSLERIVEKLLNKNPADRYQNLGLVAHDLMTASSSKEMPAPQTVVKKTAATHSKVITMSIAKFCVCTFAMMMGTALVTVYGVNTYHSHEIEVNTSPEPVSSESAKVNQFVGVDYSSELKKLAAPDKSRLEPFRIAYEKAAPIRSKIVTVEGKQMREFAFPSLSIGTVTTETIEDPKKPGIIAKNAAGAVTMPGNMPLTLKVICDSAPVVDLPFIFKKINPNEFAELQLLLFHSSRNADSDEFLPENAAKVFSVVSSWSQLQAINVRALPLNAASLSALNAMKNLTRLKLASPVVNEAELSKLPLLQRLNELMLEGFDANLQVHAIAHSRALTHLHLCDCQINPATLRELKSCKSLKWIELSQLPMSDELIQALASLKTVTGVYFYHPISSHQLEILAACPWLEHIYIKDDNVGAVKAMSHPDSRITIVK